MRGICIDTGSTTVLREGDEYYLFEHGPNNYYVSKFDNVGAHCGSYQRKHFKLVDDEQPQEHPGEIIGDSVYYSFENPDIEPVIVPIKRKRFVAVVSRWRNGYRIGDEFIISERDENNYFHVYLKDRPNKGPVGSYITDFFQIIEPYNEPEIELEPVKQKPAIVKEIEPKPLPNPPKVLPKAEKVKRKPEKPKKPEQMNIFDFLEA